MACEFITAGYSVPCANSFSGVRSIGFAEYNKNIVLTAGDVSGIGTNVIFKFELDKNDSVSYEETQETDLATNTSVVSGVLVVDLPVLSKPMRDQLRLLAASPIHAYIELYDGSILLAGVEFGMQSTSLKLATGKARKDMSGFSLSFASIERDLIPYLASAAVTAYEGLVSDVYMVQ